MYSSGNGDGIGASRNIRIDMQIRHMCRMRLYVPKLIALLALMHLDRKG